MSYVSCPDQTYFLLFAALLRPPPICATRGQTVPAPHTLDAIWPATAARQQEMGHTCQGVSQSKGIGTAPAQAPPRLNKLFRYNAASSRLGAVPHSSVGRKTSRRAVRLVPRMSRTGYTVSRTSRQQKVPVSVQLVVTGAPKQTEN